MGAFSVSDVGMIAVDMDSGKIWFGKNGTWAGSGNPATSANAAFSNLGGNLISPVWEAGYVSDVSFNFGQRPFAYTPDRFQSAQYDKPARALNRPAE